EWLDALDRPTQSRNVSFLYEWYRTPVSGEVVASVVCRVSLPGRWAGQDVGMLLLEWIKDDRIACMAPTRPVSPLEPAGCKESRRNPTPTPGKPAGPEWPGPLAAYLPTNGHIRYARKGSKRSRRTWAAGEPGSHAERNPERGVPVKNVSDETRVKTT